MTQMLGQWLWKVLGCSNTQNKGLIDTQFFIRKEDFFAIKEKPSFLILRGKN